MKIFPLKNTILNLEIKIYRTPKEKKLKKELSDFFENNLINEINIEDFKLEGNEIIPEKPYFEEVLNGGEYVNKIEQIGKKYGIKHLGLSYYCYHK